MEAYARGSHHKNRSCKKDAQMAHAKLRSKERLGFILTEDKRIAIHKAINGQEVTGINVKFKADQSRTKKLYTIYINHLKKMFDLIYDSERDVIVTFLPHSNIVTVYHYFDIFGNKINIKEKHGTPLVFDGGVMGSDYLKVEKLAHDKWHIKEWDKTFVMTDRGNLQEIIWY